MGRWKKISDELLPKIAKEYIVDEMTINALSVKYGISYTAMNHLIKSNRFAPYKKEAKLKHYDYDLNFKYNVNELLDVILNELRKRLTNKGKLKKLDNKELYNAVKTIKEIVSISPLTTEEKDAVMEAIPFHGFGQIKSKAEKTDLMAKIKDASKEIIEKENVN